MDSQGVVTGENARDWHEQRSFQSKLLLVLRKRSRRNQGLCRYEWERKYPTSRIAPIIEKLRNSWGFDIEGRGVKANPYKLLDYRQNPTLYEVTKEIKNAYWNSPHWRKKSRQRMRYDDYLCVLCNDSDNLEVHHVIYNLFRERRRELMTLCSRCHLVVGRKSRLKFPSGMPIDQIHRLGIELDSPDWLMYE